MMRKVSSMSPTTSVTTLSSSDDAQNTRHPDPATTCAWRCFVQGIWAHLTDCAFRGGAECELRLLHMRALGDLCHDALDGKSCLTAVTQNLSQDTLFIGRIHRFSIIDMQRLHMCGGVWFQGEVSHRRSVRFKMGYRAVTNGLCAMQQIVAPPWGADGTTPVSVIARVPNLDASDTVISGLNGAWAPREGMFFKGVSISGLNDLRRHAGDTPPFSIFACVSQSLRGDLSVLFFVAMIKFIVLWI